MNVPYGTLHNLKRKKWILAIKGGLYAIVPLEIGVKGAESFIVHDFVIASYLTSPYYVGMWSALNYHGLSDQIPATVFVCTPKAKKPVRVLQAKFVFVQLRKNEICRDREGRYRRAARSTYRTRTRRSSTASTIPNTREELTKSRGRYTSTMRSLTSRKSEEYAIED